MAWRLEGKQHSRFIEWADGDWVADTDTEEDILAAIAEQTTVWLTVTGPEREVTGLDDELGVYMLSWSILETGTGTVGLAAGTAPRAVLTEEDAVPDGAVS